MTTENSVDRVRDYVRQLAPPTRSRLLDELERLHLAGEDIRGSETLLTELRAEFRKGSERHERISNPPRYFFQPLEPLLVDCAPERAGCGQISRESLAAIWEWIGHALLPALAREYDAKIRHVILANDQFASRKIAHTFQDKVAKCLESALSTRDGTERIRAELSTFAGAGAAFLDLAKILSVLQARDDLAAFAAALPREIDRFEGKPFAEVQQQLNRLSAKHPQATPFALTLVLKRLRTPWQLTRLATEIATTRKVARVAATPFAVAVALVLDHLDDRRLALAKALKNDLVAIAKDILIDIYEIERALRAEIGDLENSDWGRRLDEAMDAVAADLKFELQRFPDNVDHIFASRDLARDGPAGNWSKSLIRFGRGIISDSLARCRHLLVSSRGLPGQ
jgi:hypothetical protein